jgi:hypothetical protein
MPIFVSDGFPQSKVTIGPMKVSVLLRREMHLRLRASIALPIGGVVLLHTILPTAKWDSTKVMIVIPQSLPIRNETAPMWPGAISPVRRGRGDP